MFFCGTFSITSISRMVWGLRDFKVLDHNLNPLRCSLLPGTVGSRDTDFSTTSTQSGNRLSAQVLLLLSIHAGPAPLTERTAVWLACFLSFCLGLPSLGSTVAFSAATSIATIGLYISYVRIRTCSSAFSHSFPGHPNRPARDISRQVCPWALPPRRFLVSRGLDRRRVDRVHLHRVHLAAS